MRGKIIPALSALFLAVLFANVFMLMRSASANVIYGGYDIRPPAQTSATSTLTPTPTATATATATATGTATATATASATATATATSTPTATEVATATATGTATSTATLTPTATATATPTATGTATATATATQTTTPTPTATGTASVADCNADGSCPFCETDTSPCEMACIISHGSGSGGVCSGSGPSATCGCCAAAGSVCENPGGADDLCCSDSCNSSSQCD